MNKTKRLIILFACTIIAGCIGLLFISGKSFQTTEAKESEDSSVPGRKPFRDLKASEIAFATVRLCPPDEAIQVTDLEKLADHLSDLVIYQKDNSYTEYVGGTSIFTLTMADGAQTEIMADNTFLVIDGAGYRTAYEPCEALTAYADGLLHEENAGIIMEDPPKLYVFSGQTYEAALPGSYSWQRKNDDGTFTDTEADSPHPLDRVTDLMETTETAATLRFTEEPDEILNVRCWSDKHWCDSSADSEDVSANGNKIELKPGGFIYEVTARWDTEKYNRGGTARYSFYVKVLYSRAL